jgi:succinate dehydrogenase / fumarate reductase, cytochrome b subunit
MSAIAVDTSSGRTLRFYETTNGKKVVMAVTGFILFGFLLGHMAGNLQVFAGPEKLDEYAVHLRQLGPLLWLARIVILAAVVLHIISSVQLWLLQRRARPVPYTVKKNEDSSYASRAMMVSGPIIAFFVVYHLLHFTWVALPGRYEHLKPYENIVYGFQQPLIAIFYIVAMLLLSLHLYHGLWSMFQSLGIASPAYTPKLKLFAKVFTFILAAGFIAVPVSVLLGVVK